MPKRVEKPWWRKAAGALIPALGIYDLVSERNEAERQLAALESKNKASGVGSPEYQQLQQQSYNIGGQPSIKDTITPAGLISPEKEESWLTGTPGQTLLFNPYFPAQQQRQNVAAQMGIQGLGETPLNFSPIAERYQKLFHEQTVPALAERFVQGGGINSGSFQRALGQAGSDLSSQLGALESQYNLSKHGLLQNLLRIGNQPQLQSIYAQASPGALQGLAQGVGQGIGMLPGLFI